MCELSKCKECVYWDNPITELPCSNCEENSKFKRCSKIAYKMVIEVLVIHDFDGYENLKPVSEYAETIGQLIVDECTNVNAVANYNILKEDMKIL